MIVRECMTTGAAITTPEASIREAALMMRQVDAGALPVGENDRLIGMITDRDIVTRAVADGQWAKTPVRDVMTPEIQYCFEDEETHRRRAPDERVCRCDACRCSIARSAWSESSLLATSRNRTTDAPR